MSDIQTDQAPEGRKICILGMGTTAHERRLDILKDEYTGGFELWGLNNGYLTFPAITEAGRWDRYFEIHSWEYLKDWTQGPHSNAGSYLSDLDSLGCPVHVLQPLPVIRNQRQLMCVKLARHFNSNYFRGSPSWMLMQALYEHDTAESVYGRVTHLRSFGIDTIDEQHAQQRPGWAFWCGRAIERDIHLSGTMTDFMAYGENDQGLIGLADVIGDEVLKAEDEEDEDDAPGDSAIEKAEQKLADMDLLMERHPRVLASYAEQPSGNGDTLKAEPQERAAK